MIRFKMILIGFGGITIPVAMMEEGVGSLIDFSVKQSTLHGANIIGQITEATRSPSLRRKREYLYFSVAAPGLVSKLKVGLTYMRRKPAWNSMRVFEGTISLFSRVRLSLKCITESLASFGNIVDAMMG